MNLSIRLLRAFLVVGQEGNVGRAAARLYVSQPSLSQDIRRLEKEIGVPLFVRGPRGMTLTPSGEELFTAVSAGLGSIDHGVEQARRVHLDVVPTVNFAYTPSIGNRLMPALLSVLEQDQSFHIDEQEVDTGQVGLGVLQGRFDVGLAHHPGTAAGLQCDVLVRERLYAALSAQHPLARRGSIQLSDLTGLDLLIWPRVTAPDYYDHIMAMIANASLRPRAVREFRRALTRSYLLAEGHTFSLLPASTTTMQISGVAFVRCDDPQASVELSLVKRSGDHRPEIETIEICARTLSRTVLGTRGDAVGGVDDPPDHPAR